MEQRTAPEDRSWSMDAMATSDKDRAGGRRLHSSGLRRLLTAALTLAGLTTTLATSESVPPEFFIMLQSAEVTDSTDMGDEIITPGEWFRLWIKIKNAGTSHLEDVVGTLSVDADSAAYATITENAQDDLGTVWSGGQGSHSYIRVEVNLETPPNTPLHFTYTVVDKLGHQWDLPVTMWVHAADTGLGLANYAVVNDSEGGDGLLGASELFELALTVDNLSASEALGVQGVLESQSDHLNVLADGACDFGDLVGSATVDTSVCSQGEGPRLQVSQFAYSGLELPLTYTLSIDGGPSWAFDIVLVVD